MLIFFNIYKVSPVWPDISGIRQNRSTLKEGDMKEGNMKFATSLPRAFETEALRNIFIFGQNKF